MEAGLYEETIATRRFRPIAMSVLASGRTRATGGHRLCVPTEEYSFDRIRRIEQGAHRGAKHLIDELSGTFRSVPRRARRTWTHWEDEPS